MADKQTESVVNNWEARSPRYFERYPTIVPNNGKNITIQESKGSDLISRIDAEKMVWNEKNKQWRLMNFKIRKWK